MAAALAQAPGCASMPEANVDAGADAVVDGLAELGPDAGPREDAADGEILLDSTVDSSTADLGEELPADAHASEPFQLDPDADAGPQWPPGASVSGRVIDTKGEPVPETFLVLCGTVGGKEVCNQGFGNADGTFAYTGLEPGYTHLQILTFQSETVTGKQYGGANVETAVTAADTHLELGDVPVPVIPDTATFVVADGGTLAAGAVEIVLAQDTLVFPDAGDVGQVAVVSVPLDKIPYDSANLVAAYAIYPFGSMVIDGAEVRVHLDLLVPPLAPGAAVLLHNPMDQGGLVPLESALDGAILTGTVPDLTWIAVGNE